MRCTASSQNRTVLASEWIAGEGVCPDCGAVVQIWVRGNDLCPHAKIYAHDPPPGVEPAPYKYDTKFGAMQR